MVVFEQSSCIWAKEVVFGQYGCLWAKKGFIWARLCIRESGVLGQNFCIRANECILAKWLYSRKVVAFGQVVVFGQKWLYSGKVVVFGQNGYIKAKVVVMGQNCCFQAKWLYSGKVVVLG